jgi:hypothetical protein
MNIQTYLIEIKKISIPLIDQDIYPGRKMNGMPIPKKLNGCALLIVPGFRTRGCYHRSRGLHSSQWGQSPIEMRQGKHKYSKGEKPWNQLRAAADF